MNNEKFKSGDVVILKSGGPKMTVGFVENDEVSCIWFDNNEVKETIFPVETLKKHDEKEVIYANTEE